MQCNTWNWQLASREEIRGSPQVNEKTLTRARTAKTPLAKQPHLPSGLVEGVRLTRSKSERDRMVQFSAQLAQGVEAAAAEAMAAAGTPTLMPPPLPLPWSNAELPLTRSAASELALTLNDMTT